MRWTVLVLVFVSSLALGQERLTYADFLDLEIGEATLDSIEAACAVGELKLVAATAGVEIYAMAVTVWEGWPKIVPFDEPMYVVFVLADDVLIAKVVTADFNIWRVVEEKPK